MMKQVKQLRFLQYYTITSTLLLGVLSLAAFRRSGDNLRLDELTVQRINVVDSTGRVRVMLAGSYPPRRTEVAGLLFVNNDGGEAGGLVYRGRKSADGQVSAGGILTMDQYNNDQIVALEYDQEGHRKQQGLTIKDRPDSLGPELLTLYRVLDKMPRGSKWDSTYRVLVAKVPPEQLSARRVFVGRDTSKAAVLNLSDRHGVPRLRLAVDSLGRASISFLDSHGRITRTIADASTP